MACGSETGEANGGGNPAQAASVEAASAAADARPAVMGPNEGDVLWFLHESPDALGSGGELRIFVDHETHPDARGSFAKFTLGAGGALPVHRHDKTEEIAYIVSGEGVAVALDESGAEIEIPLAPDHVWYNPPGAWHAVSNDGEEPLVLVFATIPNEKTGLLSFFRQIGVAPGLQARVLPADEFARLASAHDLILRPAEETDDDSP